jgi:hypothetical protein
MKFEHRAVWEPTLTKQHCAVLAALGGNGILGARFATGLFCESPLIGHSRERRRASVEYGYSCATAER